MKRTTRRFVLAGWCISLAGVAYLSVQPGIDLPGTAWNADKLYHMLAYAWLGTLAVWAFAGTGHGRVVASCLIPLGGLFEWIQSFVPGREASLGDAAANTLGVLLGIWLAGFLTRRLVARRAPERSGGGA